MSIRKYQTKSGEIRYQATLWSGNVAEKSKSFPRKFDAQEWHKREQLKKLDSHVGRLKGESMTLSQFFYDVYWERKKIRPGTATDYLRIFKRHIEPVHGSKKLLDIDSDDWDSLLRKLHKQGMSKARTNRVHQMISAVYGKAVKWKYSDRNPLLSVERFELDLHSFRYWSLEEARKFLSWIFETQNPRKAFYHLA